MTVNGWLQIAIFSVAVLLVTKPIGLYLLKVYDGSFRWLGRVERPIYRLLSVDPSEDQHWTRYGAGMLLFSVASMLFTYLGLRLQHVLPLNPQNLPAVPDRQAFETAASFTTNTNWQSYSGESMMSYDLVHVADLLRGLRPLLTAEAARRDVELTWDIEPGLPRVPGDRNRLLEAIELLLRHLVGHADAGAPIRIDATKTPAGVAIAVHHGPIRTAVALKLAR